MKVVGGAISTDASRFFLQVNDTKYVFDALTGKELTKVGLVRNTRRQPPYAPQRITLDPEFRAYIPAAGDGGRTPIARDHQVRLTSIASGKVVRETSVPMPSYGPVVFLARWAARRGGVRRYRPVHPAALGTRAGRMRQVIGFRRPAEGPRILTLRSICRRFHRGGQCSDLGRWVVALAAVR